MQQSKATSLQSSVAAFNSPVADNGQISAEGVFDSIDIIQLEIY